MYFKTKFKHSSLMSPAVQSHNGVQPKCELLDPASEKKKVISLFEDYLA